MFFEMRRWLSMLIECRCQYSNHECEHNHAILEYFKSEDLKFIRLPPFISFQPLLFSCQTSFQAQRNPTFCDLNQWRWGNRPSTHTHTHTHSQELYSMFYLLIFNV